jgi:DNA-binding response OmpR family regulator
VISDVGLPDSSGTALMRELKSSYGLKGIALSGALASNASAFDAYLLKPVDFDLLERTVRRLAGSSDTATKAI